MTVTTAFQDEVYINLNDASNSYTRGDMKTFEVNAQLDRLNGAPQQNGPKGDLNKMRPKENNQ